MHGGRCGQPQAQEALAVYPEESARLGWAPARLGKPDDRHVQATMGASWSMAEREPSEGLCAMYWTGKGLQERTPTAWAAPQRHHARAAAPRGRRVVALGVQGWRWARARDLRERVLALDADARGSSSGARWRASAALWGKRVAGLEPVAYGGLKDARRRRATCAGTGQASQAGLG